MMLTLLPATVRVAFLLLADPTTLVASHQYVPPSCSFLLWITRRKNSDPAGRMTRCDLGLEGAVGTGTPSLYHRISGSGIPSALQLRVSGSFLATSIEVGGSVMWGERYWPEKKEMLLIENVQLHFLPFLSL